MRNDRWEYMREVRDEALAYSTGDAMVDDYEAAAIGLTWGDLTGEVTVPSYSGAALRVRMPELLTADSHTVAVVQEKIQRAAALMAKSMVETEAHKPSVREVDRERALLVTQATSGNTVVFRFADRNRFTPGLFDGLFVGSMGERAVVDLVQRLPAGPDDEDAMGALIGNRPTVRAAMAEMVAAARISHGIVMRFSAADGSVASSQLDRWQADRLSETLKESERKTEEVELVGVLDGVRSLRRVFYLVLDNGEEVSGALDEELLQRIRDVRSHEDARVIARVERSWTEVASGKRSRTAYRLLNIQGTGERALPLGS